MSPRSPEGRILGEQAGEEDDEQQYDEHALEEPQDDSVLFTDKGSLPEEETTSDELTVRRPPSPFECFLEDAPDAHASFPPKKIILAFEDSVVTSEQHDEATHDQTEVHEFHDPKPRGQTSPKDTDWNISYEADKPDKKITVHCVADVAVELDENSDAQDTVKLLLTMLHTPLLVNSICFLR